MKASDSCPPVLDNVLQRKEVYTDTLVAQHPLQEHRLNIVIPESHKMSNKRLNNNAKPKKVKEAELGSTSTQLEDHQQEKTQKTIKDLYDFLKTLSSDSNSRCSKDDEVSLKSVNEGGIDLQFKKREPRKKRGPKTAKKAKAPKEVDLLEVIIVNILKGNRIELAELDILTEEQSYILKSLIRRKFRKQDKLAPTTSETTSPPPEGMRTGSDKLLVLIKNFNKKKVSKRVEENRKLVISMVVKHLKDSCSEKLDKMKDKHRKFYRKYFQEVFTKEGIS